MITWFHAEKQRKVESVHKYQMCHVRECVTLSLSLCLSVSLSVPQPCVSAIILFQSTMKQTLSVGRESNLQRKYIKYSITKPLSHSGAPLSIIVSDLEQQCFSNRYTAELGFFPPIQGQENKYVYNVPSGFRFLIK